MPPKGIIGEDFICVPEEGGGFTLIPKKDEGEENARDPSKPAVRSSSGAGKKFEFTTFNRHATCRKTKTITGR